MKRKRIPLDVEFLLESILSEDPDGILGGRRSDSSSARGSSDSVEDLDWGDEDARSFIIFDTFSLLGTRDLTHGEIVNFLYNQLMEHDISAQTVVREFANVGVSFSSIANATKELGSQKFQNLLSLDNVERGNRYRNVFGLSGRVWVDARVVSFWNGDEIVHARWSDVEKMFVDFKKHLGPIDKYQFDFMTGMSSADTLVQYSEIVAKHPPSTQAKQVDFFDKLDRADPEVVKKLQAKIHTMKPREKKQALMALGASNHKAAHIAAKLGMSVAEFNHIMQLDESNE